MRYLFAATAALCFASSAAALEFPDLPVSETWTDVVFYGTGVVTTASVDDPAYSDPIFEDVLGAQFSIKMSYSFLREYPEDIPYADRKMTDLTLIRLDTARPWSSDGTAEGGYDDTTDTIWAQYDFSHWGYGIHARYQFSTGIGYFALRLLDGPDMLDWSEAQGSWELKSITSSAPAAVPEPTAWGLLIAGFGLVGSALRRQRRPRIALG
jgi:hypothetical protein